MEDLVRASDITDAMTTIRVQKDKLVEALNELSKWKIEAHVEVVPSTLELKVTVQKLNGQGFIKTFTKEQALYYKDDPATLVTTVVMLIEQQLITPTLVEELTPQVSAALKNITKIARMP
jgi:hypothetical protein